MIEEPNRDMKDTMEQRPEPAGPHMFSLRLPRHIREAVQRRAEAEERSAGSVIRRILEEQFSVATPLRADDLDC